jgi:hypothetical protein
VGQAAVGEHRQEVIGRAALAVLLEQDRSPGSEEVCDAAVEVTVQTPVGIVGDEVRVVAELRLEVGWIRDDEIPALVRRNALEAVRFVDRDLLLEAVHANRVAQHFDRVRVHVRQHEVIAEAVC